MGSGGGEVENVGIAATVGDETGQGKVEVGIRD